MKVNKSLVKFGPLCLMKKKLCFSDSKRCFPTPSINNPETGMSLESEWYRKTLVHSLISNIIFFFYSFSSPSPDVGLDSVKVEIFNLGPSMVGRLSSSLLSLSNM